MLCLHKIWPRWFQALSLPPAHPHQGHSFCTAHPSSAWQSPCCPDCGSQSHICRDPTDNQSASLSLPAPSPQCCTTSARCSFPASPQMWVLPKGPSLPSAPSCPPPSVGQGHCCTSGLPCCHKQGLPLLQSSSSLLPSVLDSTSHRAASGRIQASTSTGRTVPSEPPDPEPSPPTCCGRSLRGGSARLGPASPRGGGRQHHALQQSHLRNCGQPTARRTLRTLGTNGGLANCSQDPSDKTASLPRGTVAKAASRFSPAQSLTLFPSYHVKSLKVWCLSSFPFPPPTPAVRSGCAWEAPGSRRTLGTRAVNPPIAPDFALGSAEATRVLKFRSRLCVTAGGIALHVGLLFVFSRQGCGIAKFRDPRNAGNTSRSNPPRRRRCPGSPFSTRWKFMTNPGTSGGTRGPA